MAVILDFDGVLANSFSHLAALNAEGLTLLGRKLTPTGYRRLFRGNIHDGLRRLAGSENGWRRLRAHKRRRFNDVYGAVSLFPFAPRLIRALGKRHLLGIVSSTESPHISRMLHRQGLATYFRDVRGSSARSKKNELRACARTLGSKVDDTFFITDTVGDVRVGRTLGLRTLGVGWGFHPEGWLRAARPERIFRSPTSLVRYCAPPQTHGA